MSKVAAAYHCWLLLAVSREVYGIAALQQTSQIGLYLLIFQLGIIAIFSFITLINMGNSVTAMCKILFWVSIN